MRKGIVLGLLLVLAAGVGAQPAPMTTGRTFSADGVFRALERAYPNWVIVRWGLGDPVVQVDGRSFVWADGRLLPPDRAALAPDFAPQPFYDYPATLPDVGSWPKERIDEVETKLADRRSSPPKRDSEFFDTLWGIHDRGSADDAQQKTRFLGLRVTVHKSLTAPLARIEARLQTERGNDASLDAFLKSVSRLEGYNWRDIAETQSRSNHAYGAAIDLIPRSYKGRTPYWLWAAESKGPWYRAAWNRRWEPDPAVVRAFEDEGFVWGGKWLLFDTIHFEYRPEILVLNQLR